VASAEAATTALQGELQTSSATVTELESRLTQVVSLQDMATQGQGEMQAKLDAANEAIEALKATEVGLTTNLDAANDKATVLETSIATLETQLADASATTEQGVAMLAERDATEKRIHEEHAASMSGLEAKVSAAEARIVEVTALAEEATATAKAQLSELEGKAEQDSKTLVDTTAELATLKAENEEAAAKASAVLTELDAERKENMSRKAALESMLEGEKSSQSAQVNHGSTWPSVSLVPW
jgi:chromosome segregation ATPase